ncbi:MAG: CAP domain-containing protein [Campylobacterota bacterium]|nr:CAP domain-containing protein [Campylobacterota bacterium]
MKRVILSSLLSGALALSGCGGGSGDSTSSPSVVVPDENETTEYPDEVEGSAESARGVALLNKIRSEVGLPTLKTNIRLEKAGNSHANYVRDVLATHNVSVNHYEYEEEYPSSYFTGIYAYDRAIHEGYEANSYVGEAMTYASTNVEASIDELMSAIYHRHGLLFNFIDEIGIGISSTESGNHAYTYELASYSERMIELITQSPTIVVYPPQGSTEIRRVFYEEYPDPLPDTSMSGYPISVEFNAYYTETIEVSYFRLYDENGDEVTDTTLMNQETDPNGYFTYNQFALFPMEVLEGSHTYSVEVGYVLNGESDTKVWSFTTRERLDERASY